MTATKTKTVRKAKARTRARTGETRKHAGGRPPKHSGRMRTKSFYLSDDVLRWIEDRAEASSVSASEALTMLLGEVDSRARRTGTSPGP